MDPLTLTAAATTVAGIGAGWRWRQLAHRAEVTAAVLRGELRAERHAASHDPLTGLPNRRAFYRLGAELLAAPRRHTLIAAVLDLDDFKQINDRFGHAAGDDALISIARRFAVYAGGDLVARLGGDEFAGLLTISAGDEDRLRHTEQHLASMLAAPIAVADRTVTVTASVGLALVPERTGLDEVLRRADAAMYRAKTRRIYRTRLAPTFDGPAFDGPAFDGPSFGGSSFDGSSFEHPSFEHPSFGGPTFENPSFGGPTFDSSSFESPGLPDDPFDADRRGDFGCRHDRRSTAFGPVPAQTTGPENSEFGPDNSEFAAWPATGIPARSSRHSH
jgi:diguanylate cyclase (GGDEF)-like protein